MPILCWCKTAEPNTGWRLRIFLLWVNLQDKFCKFRNAPDYMWPGTATRDSFESCKTLISLTGNSTPNPKTKLNWSLQYKHVIYIPLFCLFPPPLGVFTVHMAVEKIVSNYIMLCVVFKTWMSRIFSLVTATIDNNIRSVRGGGFVARTVSPS